MIDRNGFYSTQVRVRYAETDKMGIAYNGHYLTWFEVGRTEFLREMGITYKRTEEAGFRLPVIEAGVRYLKPAFYDDVLTIKSRFGEQPGLRITIEYEIWNTTEILATGFTKHVFTDEHLKPRRPPRAVLQELSSIWAQASSVSKSGANHD